jgi:hypothetical protein
MPLLVLGDYTKTVSFGKKSLPDLLKQLSVNEQGVSEMDTF